MLKKGDNLRPKYGDFDFSKLDARQRFWLDKLTIFTRFRQRIENKFKAVKVSTDMKILFIEQHSMKLGNAVFYTMEGSRQKYSYALEAFPYLGCALGVVYFFGFALVMPLHVNLVKESALSLLLGMVTAYAYPWYYKRIYLTNVCTVYDNLRLAIKLNPKLAKPDSDKDINKNFGPSKWNSHDSGFEDEEDIEFEDQISIFDGSAEEERK